MKKNKYFGAHIVDQQTDRSQAVLYKEWPVLRSSKTGD